MKLLNKSFIPALITESLESMTVPKHRQELSVG
jgi:hypothetical protein